MLTHVLRPSPSVVLVLIAVFLVGGGTSMAASKLIDGTTIRKHSIPANRLSGGAVHALKGASGPAGPTGPAGLPGPAGPSSAAAMTYVVGPDGQVGPNTADETRATCPPGSVVVGGGFVSIGGQLYMSKPTDDHTAWVVGASNYSGSPVKIKAYAECVPAG